MNDRRAGNPRWGSATAALLCTAVSVFAINRYRYGLYDHVIEVPFLKSLVDPLLYRSDYILPERVRFVSAFWHLLALPVREGWISLPVLLFACHLIAVFFTFLALYRIAIALFGRRDVAVLSLYFVLFSKSIIGGVPTLDLAFYPRVAALPLLLFAIDAFLRGAYLRSWVLQGIAFLVHPLTDIYVILGLLAAAIPAVDRIGRRRLLGGLAVLALLTTPIVVWRHLHLPASVTGLLADPEWVALLRFRSPQNLFPRDWPLAYFLRVGLLLAAFAWSFRHPPARPLHRTVAWFTGALLASWLVGGFLAEVAPVPLVLQLQFFRSSTFVFFLAAIYVAHAILMELERATTRGVVIAAALATGVLYDAAIWKYALACLTMLAVGIVVLRGPAGVRGSALWSAGLAAIALTLGAGVFARKDPFTIGVTQPAPWLDVQRWAARSSGIDDVFVVPPQSVGFRVESERAIYGDWKDGTMMFFDPDFGREWMRRMRSLGYREDRTWEEGFAALSEQDFRRIAEELAAPGRTVYLVTPRGRPALRFSVVFRNEGYAVYRLPLQGLPPGAMRSDPPPTVPRHPSRSSTRSTSRATRA